MDEIMDEIFEEEEEEVVIPKKGFGDFKAGYARKKAEKALAKAKKAEADREKNNKMGKVMKTVLIVAGSVLTAGGVAAGVAIANSKKLDGETDEAELPDSGLIDDPTEVSIESSDVV